MDSLSYLTQSLPPDDQEPIPGSILYMQKNFKDLKTQTLLSLIIGALSLFGFCFLRQYWPNFYSPRGRLRRGAPRRLSKSFWGWIHTVWYTPEKDILRGAGLDAIVYLRFFKMMIVLFSIMAIFSLFIMVPIDVVYQPNSDLSGKTPGASHSGSKPSVTFEEKKTLWNTILSSLLSANNAPVAHLVFGYLFVGLVYLLVTHFSYQIAYLRWNYLLFLRNSVPARTIMVSEVPNRLTNSLKLRSYFEQTGVGAVQNCLIVPRLQGLDTLLEQRANVLIVIEERYSKLIGNPASTADYNPDILKKCFYDQSQESRELELKLLLKWAKPKYQHSIPKLKKWLEETHRISTIFFQLDKEIANQRHLVLNQNEFTPSNVAFVTFKSAKSAQIAAQLSMFANPTKLKVEIAPEPRDIYWPNISSSLNSRLVRRPFIGVLVLFISFFWLVPIASLASLVSPKFIDKYFPGFYKFLKNNPLLDTFFTLTLPSFIVYGFNEIMPYMLDYLNQTSGTRSLSKRQSETIQQYYNFLVISVLLTFSLARLTYESIPEMIENPSKILELLRDSLPGAAPFFMGYIVLLGLGYYPLRLTRIGAVVMMQIRKLLSHSPRDYSQCFGPEYTRWEYLYPQSMLIFTIVMTYSSMAPLITAFGVLYFSMGYFINKYMILYVYSPRYESAGFYVYKVIKNLVGGLLIYIVLMLAIFGLQKQFTLFLLQLLLLIINFYVMTNISDLFGFGQRYIPLDMFARQRKLSLRRSNLTPSTVKLNTNLPHNRANTPAAEGGSDFDYDFEYDGEYEYRHADHFSQAVEPSTPLLNAALSDSIEPYTFRNPPFPNLTHHSKSPAVTTMRDLNHENSSKKSLIRSHYSSPGTVNHNDNERTIMKGTMSKNKIPVSQSVGLSNNSGGGGNTESSSHSNHQSASVDDDNDNERSTKIDSHTIHLSGFDFNRFDPNNPADSSQYLASGNNKSATTESRPMTLTQTQPWVLASTPTFTQTSSVAIKQFLKDKFRDVRNFLHYLMMDQYLSLELFEITRRSSQQVRRTSSTTSTHHNQNYGTMTHRSQGQDQDQDQEGPEGLDEEYGAFSVASEQYTELRWWGSADEYAIAPSQYSDYSQPGMQICYGVLDSSNIPYTNPQLVGELPSLWLPSKREN